MLKRFIQGIGANFLAQFINLASRVVLVPLFLTAWGTKVYGEWLILSSIVAYLSLTDMGGQLYIVNRLTQAFAVHDLPLFRKILHTGLALFLVLPITVFALFVLCTSLLPMASLLSIHLTTPLVVKWVLGVSAFQFVFAFPLGILLGVYRGVGLLPRGVMLGNLMQVLAIVFVAAGLLLHWSMLPIAILQLLPGLIVGLVALWDLNRLFPQFCVLSLRETDPRYGLTFIKPSFHFLLIQIAQTFSIQGMIVIVGVVLGSVQVVMFATMRTIAYSLRHLLAIIAHTAWPDMTRLDAEGNNEGLEKLFRGIMRSTLVGATFLVIIFHFFGGRIYHAWLGDAVKYSQPLMDLFLLYLLLLIVWTGCGNLLMAVNRHRTYSQVVFATSLLAIVLAYLGGRHFGLLGAVTGLVIGDGLVPLCLVPVLLSRYQVRFSPLFLLKEVAPVAVILGGVALFPLAAPVVLVALLVWWWQCVPRLGFALRR
jgi:O-antigen/teichoic acid export membrane protein